MIDRPVARRLFAPTDEDHPGDRRGQAALQPRPLAAHPTPTDLTTWDRRR